MSSLTVYRASAGSGKTFQLAAEYLKQVLANPDDYKRILAVTFTNKATTEMKERILRELFTLSQGEQSNMAGKLEQDLNLTLPIIQSRAKRALTLILHDYSRFSVSTIDSFTQRVVQALLWEVGEQGGVDIQLDPQPVLEQAADTLLDSAPDEEELLRWLTAMGQNLIDEGKSWDVRGKLIELGKQIFTESFRLMDRDEVIQFSDKNNVNSLREKLKVLKDSVIAPLSKDAKEALDAIEARGYAVNDFSYGATGVIGFFNRCAFDNPPKELINGLSVRTSDALSSPDGRAWVTGKVFSSSQSAPLISLITDVLHPSLVKITDLINSQGARYIAAKLILSNIENLALISDLWGKVRQLSRDDGFLLLSDSGHLLREFVKDSDAPFVFEKIGTRYDSFMIDEFQDTSVVQWENFKPLIEHSLSQDCFSMLVGDVKQSIYRWRNGDWRILASRVEDDFKHHGVNDIPLNDNWRSLPNIVSFNNKLFEHIVESASGSLPSLNDHFRLQIKNAYRDIAQNARGTEQGKGGYVRMSLLKSKDDSEYQSLLSESILNTIKRLKERYSLDQIAVLVRTKKEGQRVANILLEHNRVYSNPKDHIAFISQEGLQLKAASVVRVITSAFSLIQDPNHKVAARVLAKELQILFGSKALQWHSLFVSEQKDYDNAWLGSLSTRPLLEVFEAIATRFNLSQVTHELPYLAELHEHVLTLTAKGVSDPASFLQWWDQHGGRLSLSVPKSANALSILTIHKAKGLEFPVVIIPFADWSFRPSSSTPLLWVSSSEEPFNLLPRYPIYATKEARKSIFANEVLEEQMQEVVENLNLLYVAFTRPKSELYIYAPDGDTANKEGEVTSTGHLLRASIGCIGMHSDSLESECTYSIGEIYLPHVETQSSSEVDKQWTIDVYPVSAEQPPLKLRLEAREFFQKNPSDRLASIGHGKLMHELFARMQSANDLNHAIKSMAVEGLLPANQIDNICNKVRGLLDDEPIKSWFSDKWSIRTEASILTPQGYTYRPDRVMVKGDQALVVDFKFGAQDARHHKQVSRYASLLNGMGYPNTEGYVWYVDEGVLERVV